MRRAFTKTFIRMEKFEALENSMWLERKTASGNFTMKTGRFKKRAPIETVISTGKYSVITRTENYKWKGIFDSAKKTVFIARSTKKEFKFKKEIF